MCIFTYNKMRPRIHLGITWSLEELQKLLDNPNSCVHLERCRKHVALHPIHLNNLNRAFHDILGASINSYDNQFKGLILDYKSPKLLSQLGTILYDSYFIHVDIEADFYIFRPEVERVLTGTVNKKADNYIGVLVHKTFNVSITKSEEAENWEGNNLDVGDEVTFTVIHVDLKGKLPFIRGELISGLSISKKISTTSRSTFFNSDDEQIDENPIEESAIGETILPRFLNATNSDSSDTSDSETVKKKSKKHAKSSKTVVIEKENLIEDEQVSSYNSRIADSGIENDETDEYDHVTHSGSEKSISKKKKSKKVLQIEEDFVADVPKKHKKSKHKERHLESDESSLNATNEMDDSSFLVPQVPSSSKSSKKHKNSDTRDLISPKSSKKHSHNKHKIVESGIDEFNSSSVEENDFHEPGTSTAMVSGGESSSKSSKKHSKHKEKGIINHDDMQNDAQHHETRINSSRDSEIELSETIKEKDNHTKSKKKSHKDKNRIKKEITSSHDNLNVNDDLLENNLSFEVEATRVSQEREVNHSKSHKKTKIKREKIHYDEDNTELADSMVSFDSETEMSRFLSGTVRSSKSPSRNLKSKKIKQEQIDMQNDLPNEEFSYTESINTEVDTSIGSAKKNKRHKRSKSREKSLSNGEFNKLSENNSQSSVEIPNAAPQDEAGSSTKSSKKKKKHLHNDTLIPLINIKQEPMSDAESVMSKKSKKKRKHRERENDTSVDNNDDDNSREEVENTRKNKKKGEHSSNVVIGAIRVKSEFSIKEESGRKRKHDDYSSLKIKRESTLSDVEGTAVKKKIKTIFDE